MGWFSRSKKTEDFNWTNALLGLGFTVVGGGIVAGIEYYAGTEKDPAKHESSKARAAAMKCAKNITEAQLEETKLAEVITNPETSEGDRAKAEKRLRQVQAHLTKLEEEEVVVKEWNTAETDTREKFDLGGATAKAS